MESAGQSWIKSLTAPAEAGDFIAGEALFETNGALPIWFQTPVIIDMLTALVNAESSTAAFWLILPENDIERDGWAGVHPLPFLCHK